MSKGLIPGVDYLPPLPARGPPSSSSDAELAKLKEELAAKTAELERVQSELRVARFTIAQLEDENNQLSRCHEKPKTSKRKLKKKKKKKGGKPPSSTTTTTTTTATKTASSPSPLPQGSSSPSVARASRGSKEGEGKGKEMKGKKGGEKETKIGGGKDKARESAGKEEEKKEEDGDEEDEEEEEEEEVSMELIAERLPGVRLALVLQAERDFAAADADGSGVLDVKELDSFLTKRNQIYSEEQIRDMLRHVDADGDEHIDFLEYVSILHLLESPAALQKKKESMDARAAAVLGSLQHAVASSRTCVLQ